MFPDVDVENLMHQIDIINWYKNSKTSQEYVNAQDTLKQELLKCVKIKLQRDIETMLNRPEDADFVVDLAIMSMQLVDSGKAIIEGRGVVSPEEYYNCYSKDSLSAIQDILKYYSEITGVPLQTLQDKFEKNRGYAYNIFLYGEKQNKIYANNSIEDVLIDCVFYVDAYTGMIKGKSFIDDKDAAEQFFKNNTGEKHTSYYRKGVESLIPNKYNKNYDFYFNTLKTGSPFDHSEDLYETYKTSSSR